MASPKQSPHRAATPSAEGGSLDSPETSLAVDSSLGAVMSALVAGYGQSGTAEGKELFAKTFGLHIQGAVAGSKVLTDYNVVVMFDNTTMIKADSDRIYKALTAIQDKNRPLLLLLVSNGGEPGSAYLIGQLCRELSTDRFVVVVPRHAKSAATLLACAADEIHMGSLSELGPIDPQFNGMPALGLKNSIEHIAELVSRVTGSAELFARYLHRSIEPIQIGYYERVAESAVQYAERLLATHQKQLVAAPADIATKLVYGYKDHGFVIDKTEATAIFGPNTIKTGSDEYQFGNTIYSSLAEVETLARLLGYTFYFIGSLDSRPVLTKRRTA